MIVIQPSNLGREDGMNIDPAFPICGLWERKQFSILDLSLLAILIVK